MITTTTTTTTSRKDNTTMSNPARPAAVSHDRILFDLYAQANAAAAAEGDAANAVLKALASEAGPPPDARRPGPAAQRRPGEASERGPSERVPWLQVAPPGARLDERGPRPPPLFEVW